MKLLLLLRTSNAILRSISGTTIRKGRNAYITENNSPRKKKLYTKLKKMEVVLYPMRTTQKE
jgi:hypothetical protein